MKKNNMMRLASGLLVAVLISTSTISGTFAKYVTEDSSTDTARVAEFGVRITANGQIFTDTHEGIEANWSGKNTVDGQGENVVAPGTSGDMVKMTLTGQPEVAVRVTYDLTTFDLTDWTLYDGNTEYCPIIFSVNNETYGTNDTSATNKFSTVSELKDAITSAVEDYSKEYEPNTDLSGVGDDSLAISWEWPFSVDKDHDIKDTILGDKAAGINQDGTLIEKAPAGIDIGITTTVTQID